MSHPPTQGQGINHGDGYVIILTPGVECYGRGFWCTSCIANTVHAGVRSTHEADPQRYGGLQADEGKGLRSRPPHLGGQGARSVVLLDVLMLDLRARVLVQQQAVQRRTQRHVIPVSLTTTAAAIHAIPREHSGAKGASYARDSRHTTTHG